MPTLIINGKTIEVEDGLNLLQACEQAGFEIPRFCYHERLSIAGNCRMCLVEVVGMPKPVASCHMAVSDLRPGRDGTPPTIRTDTPTIKKAREGVMEFLLLNHPLDCPICDQGGECDLQDQAMAYGIDDTRSRENKRAVEDKNLGPLIKTFMTRCIQCTRCVRFITEVAGVPELGLINRGEDAEITTYLEQGIMSEMSGNLIDVCPVGALTSKPYAFKARPWELRKTESIDVMDAVGSNIRVDTRGRDILRIMPRNHDGVNEEWISDKTRFVWDGIRRSRLDRPYRRRNGKLEEATWRDVFNEIADRIKAANPALGSIGAIAGDLVSVEDMYALKCLFEKLGSTAYDCRQDGSPYDPSKGRATYMFNSTIAGIDEADLLLLVGTNPRLEATVLNARIFKNWRAKKLKVAVIGQPADLAYEYEHLGNAPQVLSDISTGKHVFGEALRTAKRPMMIVGQAALTREDSPGVLSLAAQVAVNCGLLRAGDNWNGFNILHTAAARVGGLDLGFVPWNAKPNGVLEGVQEGKIEFLYLLGADEFDISRIGDAFVVYQGSHGDRGARLADIILPGSAYTEKSGTYVNTEGRVQMAERLAFPPGDAREDWTIIRALSERLDAKLGFDSLAELRAQLYRDHPHFAALDMIAPGKMSDIEALALSVGKVSQEPFGAAIEDFYQTNPIARASAVMTELSNLTREHDHGATGTDG